jgi:plastocyanin
MGRNVVGAVMGTVAATAVLTACSSGGSGDSSSAAIDSTSSSPSSPAGGASSSAGAGSAPRTVTVSATEFKLSLPTTTFSPGTYTFRMSDDGQATHAIEIQGPGVDGQKSDTAGPGGTASLTVTLQKGTYTMWCPVANHRAVGMQTTLTVG